MTKTVERVTAEDYLAREYPGYTQLVDGVVVMNAPGFLHQEISLRFCEALRTWARRETGHGTVSSAIDVVLDSGNVLVPDVLWFRETIDLREMRAPRVPDLVLEIRSPSTWRYDVGRKRVLYEHHGVRELWLADTASRTLLVYRRSAPRSGFDIALELAAEETLDSPLLPGFAERVGALLPAVT